MTKKFLFPFIFFAAFALVGCSNQTGIKNVSSIESLSPPITSTKVTTNNSPESNLTSPETGSPDFALTDLRQATLMIEGMFCPSCATGIEYAFKANEGVVDALVVDGPSPQDEGWVIYNPELTSPDEFTQLAKPYTATVVKDEKAAATKLTLPKE